jgi:hypothetical protein
MSDTIKLELDQGTYNGLHAIVGTFAGAAGTIGASKLRELITDAVRANLVGDNLLPQTITLDVPKTVIDKLYEGVKVKLAEPKITTTELEQLKAVCKVLKVSGRFTSHLETLDLQVAADQDFDSSEVFDEA